MKFMCYKKDLIDALQFVIKAVAIKPMTPILAGIYLQVENSTLELQANNYSTGIVARIPASIEIPGEIVIGGKRFHDFIRNMPDDTINFSDENPDHTLEIKSGGACVELMTMTADDFPKVKTPKKESGFTVRSTMLNDLIRKTSFAAAKDETRPVFTGCAFEISDKKISVVATNTHRLALATDELADRAPDCNFVVPRETLRGIMQRINQTDFNNYVIVDYAARNLMFTFDNVYLNSRLIEGHFPPYDRVIPSSSSTNVVVKTSEFKNAVEFVALMSKETEYNTVKFVIGDGGIEISSNSPEVGNAIRNIAAEIEGEEMEISFNAQYILDVLKVIDSDKVNIALNDRYSPAAFTEPGNDKYIYVATPVRT